MSRFCTATHSLHEALLVTSTSTAVSRRNKADAAAAGKERDAAVDAKRQKVMTQNPGRKPGWSQERLDQVLLPTGNGVMWFSKAAPCMKLWGCMQMDRLALEERKRCIMWDDEGAGFYLVS